MGASVGALTGEERLDRLEEQLKRVERCISELAALGTELLAAKRRVEAAE